MVRIPLVAMLVASAGCAARQPAPHACPDRIAELCHIGDEAGTIDVVVYAGAEQCITGNARHFTVWIDDRQHTAVDVPCWRDPRTDHLTIVVPVPGYDGGQLTVDEGQHAVRVVDEDTRLEDHETFAVPHVELDGDGLTVGNHVDAWVGREGVSVRGPTTLRRPRL